MEQAVYKISISEYTDSKSHNDYLERKARETLKKMFRGDWNHANYTADVIEDYVLFKVEEAQND